MKKLLIAVESVIGLFMAGVLAYRLASPEIVIANLSQATVEEVVIRLPLNRIAFGQIAPGKERSIYYSASQADGEYNYTVKFPGQLALSGSCGYVTNSDYGKRLQLVVLGTEAVECGESNKIF
jgi:hypothetical protein